MDAHANFAYSTVATAPSPASSGTSLVVASGDGTKFPATPFNATVWPAGSRPSSTNAEIVRVTGIATDTLTITRTQEGTSARSIIAGDQIAATVTKKTLTDIELGGTQLVYRYTVTGSDKASIDTGVDTADAGSNDWTDGDLLEVFMVIRTDNAAASDSVNVTLNNDTGSNYDKQTDEGSGTSATAARVAATTAINIRAHGSGGTSGYPAAITMKIPRYAGTVFNKVANIVMGWNDNADGVAVVQSAGWRNTAAITRLKVAGVSTSLLKVGSTLLIYKRKAS